MNHALIMERRVMLQCKGEVFLLRRAWTDTFCLRIQFPVGTFRESAENNGISYLCVRMLLEGTREKSFLQIAEDLESVGIEVQSLSNGLQFHCSTHLQDHLIQFLQEILCEAEPTLARFEQTLKHMRSELRTYLDESDHLAFAILRQRIYADSIGALFSIGSEQSLKSIDYEDFLAYRKRYFCGKNLKVFVAGHIDEVPFLDSLDRALENFEPGSPDEMKPPHFAQTRQNCGFYVIRDRNKSSVVLGHGGISKWSQEYSRLKVMDQILGQSMGFTCRLAGRLREELGLCYSVFGDITSSASRLPGLFQIYIGTNPESVQQALSEIRLTLQEFLEDGPEIEEVEDTRLQLTEGFVFQFETNAAMVQILYEKISYGLEADFLIQEQEIIKNISCEEVHRVAEEYLHPEKLVTVVVGREPIEGFIELPGTIKQ